MACYTYGRRTSCTTSSCTPEVDVGDTVVIWVNAAAAEPTLAMAVAAAAEVVDLFEKKRNEESDADGERTPIPRGPPADERPAAPVPAWDGVRTYRVERPRPPPEVRPPPGAWCEMPRAAFLDSGARS